MTQTEKEYPLVSECSTGYLVNMGDGMLYHQRREPETASQTPLSAQERVIMRLIESALATG